MSGCIEPKIIIERLRKGDKFTNEELASVCVVSLCDKLRAELRPEDLEMVKRMLNSENPNEACISQVLVRPFLHEDGMKDFLIELWENTENDNLKLGLLFDLFLYTEKELSANFVDKAFDYLEEEKCAFSQMMEEWLEGEERILEEIKKHLAANTDNTLKTALWLFSLISISINKSQEVKKTLDNYKNNPEPLIKRVVDFVDKTMTSTERDESLEEVSKKWQEYFISLKHSIKEGAESVFGNDNEIRIFINIRNRHLRYKKLDPEIKEIPQLQWRYLGLDEDDVVSDDSGMKDNVIKFLCVELFGGGFLSGEFHVEDYIKVITLKDYFSSTDDINSIESGDLGKFIESLISDTNFKHPKNDEEENSLRKILNNKLKESFPKILGTDKERWEKILKLIERKSLFTEDQIQKGISIMLAVTFGAYYPMDIFVTFIPRNDDKDSLGSKLKCAIKLSNRSKRSEAVSFWKLPLDEYSKTKVLLLERAFSQVVMHLFTKIYALYFQHLITRGKKEIIRQGLSVMLSAPADGPCGIKVVEINENDLVVHNGDWLIKGTYCGSNKRQAEKDIKETLKDCDINTIDQVKKNVKEIVSDSYKNSLLFLKEKRHEMRIKLDSLIIWLPYPFDLDPGEKNKEQEYKEITRFKVNELLTKLEEYYTNILNEQKKLRMKDAVVAIMGRNMSHNIGSHVLWHLGEDLIIDKNMLEDEANRIKSFYTYLRERMGFIALIATHRPIWSTERDFVKTIDHFDSISLLKENIVLTEKMIKDGYEYRFIPKIEMIEDQNKGFADLPHGSYGAQALYVILENIIRNTIKHNRHKLVENISHKNNKNKIILVDTKFLISISEPSNKAWMGDYFKVTIQDHLNNYSEDLDRLIEKLQKKANESIFDEFGRRRMVNLGFKEKRICAAFLRMIPHEEIDSEEIKRKILLGEIPPLLKIDKKDNHLTHIVYLKKPKRALIITDSPELLNSSVKSNLNQKGIDVEDKGVVDEILKSESLNHKFLVLMVKNDGWVNGFVQKNRLKLPFRLLSTSSIETNRSWSFISPDKIRSNIPKPDNLYNLFWDYWVKGYFEKDYKSKKVLIVESDKKSRLDGFPAFYKIIAKQEFIENSYENSIALSHDMDINENLFDKVFMCEGYSGDRGVGEIIVNLENSEYYHLYYQLFESFLWEIAVIDERIFDKKNNKRTPTKFKFEIPIDRLWEKRQIRLIDPEKFIKGDWNSIGKPNILVLHQGIIDKYKDTHNKNDFEKRWEDEIRKNIPFLVIDSDRGKPEKVEDLGAVWIQFSDLGDIIVHQADNSLSKYLLVNILTSLRG